MNMCANHPDLPAVAYCRTCGKPMCEQCRLTDPAGAIYCAEHLPVFEQAAQAGAPAAEAYAPGAAYTNPAAGYPAGAPPYEPVPPSPYTDARERSHISPPIAGLLGAIPGVGAIYNGQYAKGLIHAVIFGLLITVASNGSSNLGPLVGILISVFWFYMLLEAYHTARKRRDGFPVDEFSSIIELRGGRAGFPVLAIVLIALGVVLLLDTTGLVSIDRLVRYWPITLIFAGAYMLYARMDRRQTFTQEFSDERR